jgi:alkanesulfonate monooxygenase SsuD/methylene tetrahydromethanopterin reductase-like flavin-dependent oxidoreductase (luciferase family)
VTHDGRVRVEEARVWSLPAEPPLLVGAALSEPTAEFVGSWADALITVDGPRDQLDQLIAAFRRGGGDGKPLYLQSHVSYARSDEEARSNAWDQWRSAVLPATVNEQVRTVAELEAAATFVRPDDMDRYVRISSDPARHTHWLRERAAIGFERIYVHNVGRNQREFVETYGERVLPELA